MTTIMTSTSCNYIQQLDQATDKSTELVGQLGPLDHHIHELNKSRSTIIRYSNQFHSPIYRLPNEILSYIFRKCVDSKRTPAFRRKYIHEAMVLSSVSSHWRQVALGTSKLWGKLEFRRFSEETSLDAIACLIQYCTTHAPSLDITIRRSVFDSLDEHFPSGPFIAAIFRPETVPKIKGLRVYQPGYHLIETLPSLSSLQTLFLRSDLTCCLDLRSLPLAEVHLTLPHLESITLPPSVQFLHIHDVPLHLAMALLYQCPMLTDCLYDPKPSVPLIPFTGTLALDKLKKLICSAEGTLGTVSSMPNLQLRSLKALQLEKFRNGRFDLSFTTAICHQVSATLQSLTFSRVFLLKSLWKHLFNSHLPVLRSLTFYDFTFTSLPEALLALTPDNKEEDEHREQYLPNLRFLTINTCHELFTECSRDHTCRSALDLMKKRRVGETHSFHLSFLSLKYGPRNWPLHLKEELEELVARPRVRVTWNGKKIAC